MAAHGIDASPLPSAPSPVLPSLLRAPHRRTAGAPQELLKPALSLAGLHDPLSSAPLPPPLCSSPLRRLTPKQRPRMVSEFHCSPGSVKDDAAPLQDADVMNEDNPECNAFLFEGVNLHVELEVYKAMLAEEVKARGELQQLLRKRDSEICELTRRYKSDQEKVNLLERTVLDYEITVSDLENKLEALKKKTEQQRLQKEEVQKERSLEEDGTPSRPDSISMNNDVRSKEKHARDNCGVEQESGQKRIRRQTRKWTSPEVTALRKGVHDYGRGHWKLILSSNPDCFIERTAVDLKDKWRNLMKCSYV